MKTLWRPNESRWHKKDAWKTSAYAFVPHRTFFGELCGFADDIVNPGQGFGMHPHEDMEISTIVLSGAQVHRDSTGSERVIGSNGVPTMSAGTGILHSEYNASNAEPFHSFQIWFHPKERRAAPRHEHFGHRPENKLNTILLALTDRASFSPWSGRRPPCARWLT